MHASADFTSLSPSAHLLPALQPLLDTPVEALLAPFKQGPITYYATTDPALSSIVFCLWLSFVCWVASEITGNLSQVDRLWTFLPTIYSYHFAFHPLAYANHSTAKGTAASVLVKTLPTYLSKLVGAGGGVQHTQTHVDPRMALVAGLQTLWMLRLSTNSYRRGFFSSFTEEDYRWPVLRENVSWWQLKVINLSFIAFAQNILLLLTALPQYSLLTSPSHSVPLHTTDYVLSGLYVLILAIEMMGDNAQQRYQNWKYSVKDDEKKMEKLSESERYAVKRGFAAEGLFSWSRHPNFACEVAHWWLLPLFPTFAVYIRQTEWAFLGLPVSLILFTTYPFIGPLSMTALFYSSTPFTEYITKKKYPLYKEYQRRVGMLWPTDTIFKALLLRIDGSEARNRAAIYGEGAIKNDVVKAKVVKGKGKAE